MQLNIADQQEPLQVADAVFACDYNEALLHQVIVAHMAGGRKGSVAQKTRSEVAASGRKPWRQKGLGRARAGTVTSPLWRGGGVTFAAKPRDYRQKVNRKMYQKAIRVILSEFVRQQRLIIVNELAVDSAKTKALVTAISAYKVDRGIIITADNNETIYLAARNLPHIAYSTVAAINPVTLVKAEQLVITVKAIKRIEEWLA